MQVLCRNHTTIVKGKPIFRSRYIMMRGVIYMSFSYFHLEINCIHLSRENIPKMKKKNQGYVGFEPLPPTNLRSAVRRTNH